MLDWCLWNRAQTNPFVCKVSDGGSKKCQHVRLTHSHTHSVTHTHTETWIRCEFRFDLTNRKSFILHTQGRPCQLCCSHARTWNCFLLDALRFRQLSSSLSTSLWFPAALRPSSQWDLCAFCIFLCAPLKVLDKNGPSSEVKSSRGEASRGVACLAGRHAQFSLRDFYDFVCLRVLTFIECKLFCNNVIESVYWCVYFVLAAIIAGIVGWKGASGSAGASVWFLKISLLLGELCLKYFNAVVKTTL